jgi:hypothetical protein
MSAMMKMNCILSNAILSIRDEVVLPIDWNSSLLSYSLLLASFISHLRTTLWTRKRRFQRREKKNFLYMILPTRKHKLQKMYYSGLPLTESCNDHIVPLENRSFVSPAKKLRHGTGETKDVRLRGRGRDDFTDRCSTESSRP